MGAVTAGETARHRADARAARTGVHRQARLRTGNVNKDLRVRLTGSMYKTDKAMSDTLYSGDRAGSRYYFVLENTAATEIGAEGLRAAQSRLQEQGHGVSDEPVREVSAGWSCSACSSRRRAGRSTEATDRTWNQYALDTVYRFLPDEQAVRRCALQQGAGSSWQASPATSGANRWEFGGGWFITANVLAKAEYVNQKYFGYPVDQHQERRPLQRRHGRRSDRLLDEAGQTGRDSRRPGRRSSRRLVSGETRDHRSS